MPSNEELEDVEPRTQIEDMEDSITRELVHVGLHHRGNKNNKDASKIAIDATAETNQDVQNEPEVQEVESGEIAEKKRKFPKCPKCDKNFKDINRHLVTIHGAKDREEAKKMRIDAGESNKDQRPLKACPVCKKDVYRLDKHLATVHSEKYPKGSLQFLQAKKDAREKLREANHKVSKYAIIIEEDDDPKPPIPHHQSTLDKLNELECQYDAQEAQTCRMHVVAEVVVEEMADGIKENLEKGEGFMQPAPGYEFYSVIYFNHMGTQPSQGLYLIFMMIHSNAQRSGVAKGLLVSEFKSTEYREEESRYVMLVKDHKTSLDGPAPIVMDKELYGMIQKYYTIFRPIAVAENAGIDCDAFFLTRSGAQLNTTRVSAIFNALGQKYGRVDKGRLYPTKFRQAAVSSFSKESQQKRDDLSRLMTHREPTARAYYMLEDNVQRSITAQKDLSKKFTPEDKEQKESEEKSSKEGRPVALEQHVDDELRKEFEKEIQQCSLISKYEVQRKSALNAMLKKEDVEKTDKTFEIPFKHWTDSTTSRR
ncbi:hypothetical protein QZH41_009458, partial [Actinostola sp. cb2023]